MKTERTAIAASALKKHIRDHANTIDPETKKVIGANCDCPRETKTVTINCIGCSKITNHMVLRRAWVPKRGDDVLVSEEALQQTFGDDVPADPVGMVVKVLHPEDKDNDHELPHGFAVIVTWDPAPFTRAGALRSKIETYAFDLQEVSPT